jgi:hypothetical protein
MNRIRWSRVVVATMTVASCWTVVATCGGPFGPEVPDEGVIIVRNRSAADTVTQMLLAKCDSISFTNELGPGGMILPDAEGVFEVEKDCHDSIILERNDTIARRARIHLNPGDTAIILLRPRS